MNNNKFKQFFCNTGDWFKSLFTVQNGQEPKLLTLYKKPGTKSIISSLLCILAGVLVGFIVMLIIAAASPTITAADAFRGLGIILGGPFSSGTAKYISMNFGDMIFYAGPLIMTGLSVAIAFKTGLFNIGAPGQYYMGAMGSLLVALSIPSKNGAESFFIWLFAVVVGMAFGALWGAIPGLFRAFFNVNEVIVCIMTNWISANIVTWVFSSMPQLVNTGMGKSGYLITTAATGNGTPKIGLDKLFVHRFGHSHSNRICDSACDYAQQNHVRLRAESVWQQQICIQIRRYERKTQRCALNGYRRRNRRRRRCVVLSQPGHRIPILVGIQQVARLRI